MDRSKRHAIKTLIRSKTYVLVTDKESIVNTDFSGFSGMMTAHAIKMILQQLDDVLKEWEGAASGGKQTRRKKSSNNKQG